jgi:hypothetical protein
MIDDLGLALAFDLRQDPAFAQTIKMPEKRRAQDPNALRVPRKLT